MMRRYVLARLVAGRFAALAVALGLEGLAVMCRDTYSQEFELQNKDLIRELLAVNISQ